jgi:hypothetical protein
MDHPNVIREAGANHRQRRVRWTLRLLASRTLEWVDGDAASYETVRRTLKKTISSRG